jgi:rRNA-processing protein FCF1
VAQEKETLKIILDANFLFIPAQFKVDIFEELLNLLKRSFEPVLLSSTKQELQGLAKSSTKIQKQAILALSLSEKCRFVSIEKSLDESYDDIIVRVAAEWKCPVGTNDKELRKRLRKVGIPVIFLRQKRVLAVDGGIGL